MTDSLIHFRVAFFFPSGCGSVFFTFFILQVMAVETFFGLLREHKGSVLYLIEQ